RHHFDELVGELLDPAQLEGVVWSDGALSSDELTLPVAELLRDGGPWGQAFPEPTFDGQFRILQQRLVGERHLKLMLEPLGGGPLLDGIAFNVDTALWPDASVREVELAYRLDINEYRGNRSVQLMIQHLWPR
ncbi:MAG: single-stranded-DNA-specific exonuclease RecJ, partial [Edwardsiella sp. (in: enterobacteria)]